MMTCGGCGALIDPYGGALHTCPAGANHFGEVHGACSDTVAIGAIPPQPFLATQTILTEADVRRIVREELDARKESKP